MIQANVFEAGVAPPPQKLRQHLRELLADSWKDFQKSFKRCRARFSESSVHQLRVESRRLQALLGLLETLVGQAPIAPAHRRVKEVLRRFTRLRDTQVLLLQVEQKLKSFPGLKPFRNALRERERRLIRKTGGRMHRARLGKIKARMAAADGEARRVLAEQGRQGQHWKRLLEMVTNVVAQVTRLRARCRADDLKTIHRLRIAFKRFRYTIELLQPVLPGVTQREIRELRAVQNRLGQIQDADVLVAALDKFSRKKPERADALRKFRRAAERRRDLLVHAFLTGSDRIHEFGMRHPAQRRPSTGAARAQPPPVRANRQP